MIWVKRDELHVNTVAGHAGTKLLADSNRGDWSPGSGLLVGDNLPVDPALLGLRRGVIYLLPGHLRDFVDGTEKLIALFSF